LREDDYIISHLISDEMAGDRTTARLCGNFVAKRKSPVRTTGPKSLSLLVGAGGFEPPTPRSRTERLQEDLRTIPRFLEFGQRQGSGSGIPASCLPGHRRHAEHQRRRCNAELACCATLRDATVIAMTLKARVKSGRLVVDEPTDLPEGTEIELLPLDPGDWLDEEDRAALHRALKDSDEDIEAGRLIDADVILRELRSR